MKNSAFILLFGTLLACTSTKTKAPVASYATTATPAPSPLTTHVEAVRKQFAPDKRTVLFDVTAKENGVLSGETIVPEAKAALLSKLQAANLAYTDSITVLPEAELEGKHYGVVTISVANIRSQPKHPAELATQATMGTPVKVWKKENGWYLVQTPDNYLAWVDYAGIKLMTKAELDTWQKGEKLIYTNPYGFALTSADKQSATISDLVYGDVVVLKNKTKDFYEVNFPDGRTGFILAAEAMPYKNWIASRQPSEENLVKTSKQLLGLPYLWGGTSFKGVDCSGFTKTVYFMNGIVLPRDASQQVHEGELVDTDKNWDKLRPGDLLFFGVPAKDGKPERVVHVGMWIGGDKEFIHSAGRVRINSMNPAAANYDDYENNRYLRTKRMKPSQNLIDLRASSIY
ncbi:C40 family peptidase [Pontibacter cellulosilyticus]|uniref:C40 family peptidase n=1 Tax=Pontibacter cellulosilyticus TaxID=1720253 RepID=A0A923N4E1_9BACT|nr:SH3 domain-containing C40 family peptidase [Pontibacter cellulosilyticus]MBC5992323.1 C40 family peptidase [Pontibacter cellulosilyticus]